VTVRVTGGAEAAIAAVPARAHETWTGRGAGGLEASVIWIVVGRRFDRSSPQRVATALFSGAGNRDTPSHDRGTTGRAAGCRRRSSPPHAVGRRRSPRWWWRWWRGGGGGGVVADGAREYMAKPFPLHEADRTTGLAMFEISCRCRSAGDHSASTLVAWAQKAFLTPRLPAIHCALYHDDIALWTARCRRRLSRASRRPTAFPTPRPKAARSSRRPTVHTGGRRRVDAADPLVKSGGGWRFDVRPAPRKCASGAHVTNSPRADAAGVLRRAEGLRDRGPQQRRRGEYAQRFASPPGTAGCNGRTIL
jgi:hypothetical protein